MKKILLILLLSFSLISYGKTINVKQLQNRNGIYYEINQETPYTGEAIGYYENGKIKVKRNYKNGKINGEWFSYYENGEVEVSGNFKNGKMNGECIYYYGNGQIKGKENYKDGVKL